MDSSEKRFPTPTELEIQEAEKKVEQLARDEIFELSPSELAIFIWDIFKRGRTEPFHYFEANPISLTPSLAKKPATILLHGYSSNQGEWLPLLKALYEYQNNKGISLGPVFTIEYPKESSKNNLIKKIEEIKELYKNQGEESVDIYLVGHSRGAITSIDYTYDPTAWVSGTQIKKVVSIAGRIKNVDPPISTPFYPYCYRLLPYIDELYKNIKQYSGNTQLFVIAAENDWLVPLESVVVPGTFFQYKIVPKAGHALIERKIETISQIISWLYEKGDANEM